MRDLIEDFVSRPVWAVVGFSANPLKFGHRIYFDLLRAGYQVYAVNRRGGRQAGESVYASVEHLPVSVDVVDVVVPPQEGIQVVRQCVNKNLNRVWLQPGAESPEIIQFCNQEMMQVVFNACAMVEKKRFASVERQEER